MRAIDLAELAATFASHSDDMLALRCMPDRQAQQSYWLAARFRHDYWSSRLAVHRHELKYCNLPQRSRSWLQVMPVMEEVLVAEPLARIVAYHGRLLSEHMGESDLAAISQSVLNSHVEARHRCLHLIVFGDGLAVEQNQRLNQIRRILESYNDDLLGQLRPIGHLEPFAFESLNVQQSQADEKTSAYWPVNTQKLHLLNLRMTLRIAITRKLSVTTPSFQANARLGAAVLQLLPPQLFDSVGLPRTQRTARLLAASAESMPPNQLGSYYKNPALDTQPQRSPANSSSIRNRRW